jgi:site-specific DNA recombinase
LKLSDKALKHRVIGIIRVSTDSQDLERQRVDVRSAARAHNLDVIRTLELSDLSGTKMLGAPQVRQALADLSRPDIDGVVCSAVDRLVRPGQLGDLAFFDSFQRSKKLIFTPGQIIDMTTNAGFLSTGILGVVAGFERQMILSRTLAGKEICRQRGGSPNGPQSIPRGLAYDKRTHKWSYVEPYASMIRQAYDLIFERRSYKEIARRLGGTLSHQVLRLTLRSPVWKGIRAYTAKREAPLEISMGIEPLISPERWEAAQRIMLDRHSTWLKIADVKSEHLLNGLVKCSCGQPMYLRGRGRLKWKSYYACRSSLKPKTNYCGAKTLQQPATDAAVSELISRRLIDPSFLREILGRREKAKPAHAATRARLDKERSKLEAERQKLLRLTLSGACTEDDFRRESKRIQSAISALDAVAPAETAPAAPDPAKLCVRLSAFAARLNRLPFAERRDVLRTAVRDVVINQNREITAITLNGSFLDGDNLETRSI